MVVVGGAGGCVPGSVVAMIMRPLLQKGEEDFAVHSDSPHARVYRRAGRGDQNSVKPCKIVTWIYVNLKPVVSSRAISDKQQNTTKPGTSSLFLARSLLCSLSNLSSLLTLVNALNDTNSDGLSHIPNSEPSERRIISECFNAHELGGDHLDDGGVSGLDEIKWG